MITLERIKALAAERSARGATYMDEKHPDWVERLDNAVQAHEFNIDSCFSCVLGTYFMREYLSTPVAFNLTVGLLYHYGFDAPSDMVDGFTENGKDAMTAYMDELQKAWERIIAAKVEAAHEPR